MKKFLYIILVFTFLGVAFSCVTEEERRRITQAEKERLRKEDSASLKIGVCPTEDCLPIVVAKHLRLYDTLGIDVHLKYLGAISECRHALTNKKVEGAAIDTLLMKQLNGDSTWLYDGLRTELSWQFFTAKKARISRTAQLADKTIGADSHGASHLLAEQTIDSLLRKNLHTFIVQIEDPRIRLDMLASGNIDAALLPEPFATKARKVGAKHIASVKSSPAGVIAFRKEAMNDSTRQHQYKMFIKAVGIANDSIKKYGKDHYIKFLEW
ncbi:MAG: hypothetical protein KBT34_13535 [Prevotella sp.]|nr:hypothetical protein [Candidatus Prevotella equi]